LARYDNYPGRQPFNKKMRPELAGRIIPLEDVKPLKGVLLSALNHTVRWGSDQFVDVGKGVELKS